MNDLQEELRDWHSKKYPRASLPEIGLKLAEECGEACRSIDRIIHESHDETVALWKENLTEEIGDAAIVLMILCIRNHVDFEDVVRQRAFEVMQR